MAHKTHCSKFSLIFNYYLKKYLSTVTRWALKVFGHSLNFMITGIFNAKISPTNI